MFNKTAVHATKWSHIPSMHNRPHDKSPVTADDLATVRDDRSGREPTSQPGTLVVRYVAQKRRTKKASEAAFVSGWRARPPVRTKGAQELRAPFRRSPIHVPNRPPRFPAGAWPIEMRADMAAAYLDFPSTRALCKSIARGEAPKPDSTRGAGAALEVVWFTKSIDEFVAHRRKSSGAGGV